jgi:MFS family permease
VDDAPIRRWPVIAGLGTSQTLAWASSYYLVAILAPAMARDTQSSATGVFAAFSASLLISAVLGPRVGRTIDRFGGREVLAASNLMFAAGLSILALAHSLPMLWAGWLMIGAAMGLGLYDAAFATLGRMYGQSARSAITGITLIAGFASTVGWPLTAWGEAAIGWRGTCALWALAHLLLGLPLNLLLLPKIRGVLETVAPSAKPHVAMDRTMWLLGFAFAAGWFVSTAMAAHLPRLLESAGATTAQAIAAASLVGPAQVAARVLEASFLSRYHPVVSARLSTLTHPIGAGALLIGGGWLTIPFTLLHGAGNGILTIARGTVPLAVFGPENYGYRLGLLGAPARILQAGAPIAFGILIDRFGAHALVFSSLTCMAATLALLAVSASQNSIAKGEP